MVLFYIVLIIICLLVYCLILQRKYLQRYSKYTIFEESWMAKIFFPIFCILFWWEFTNILFDFEDKISTKSYNVLLALYITYIVTSILSWSALYYTLFYKFLYSTEGMIRYSPFRERRVFWSDIIALSTFTRNYFIVYLKNDKSMWFPILEDNFLEFLSAIKANIPPRIKEKYEFTIDLVWDYAVRYIPPPSV